MAMRCDGPCGAVKELDLCRIPPHVTAMSGHAGSLTHVAGSQVCNALIDASAVVRSWTLRS